VVDTDHPNINKNNFKSNNNRENMKIGDSPLVMTPAMDMPMVDTTSDNYEPNSNHLDNI